METIKKYFPEITRAQKEKLVRLSELLKEFNQEVNMISRKDIDNVLLHHVVPAAAILKTADFKKCESVLDIGTGGGLPGLPLAICFPETSFILIDSIAKKIKIVQKLIYRLDLKNVKAVQVRSNEMKDKYDYVVGRGVSEPHAFFKLAQKNLIDENRKNAVYYISGEVEENDLRRIELSKYFSDDYFLGKYIYILN